MNMKNLNPILLGLSLAVIGGSFAAAQDAASTSSVPHILQITREYTKPYKGGAAHDKTESAFITANRQAKFPANYVGMNSLTGKARSLYMTRYSSFAEWEKDNALMAKNASFATEIERDSLARLRQRGRTELMRAVVAENQVFHENGESSGESGNRFDSIADHPCTNHDVAEQAAFGGIFDAAGVAEFFDLADVVKDNAREKQIGVELGVVFGNGPREAREADDMLQ